MNRFACVICGEPYNGVNLMCGPCGRSYDRSAHDDGSVFEAMRWAALRARRFERKRAKAARSVGRE